MAKFTILQIIPAPSGMRARFNFDEEASSPVVALALCRVVREDPRTGRVVRTREIHGVTADTGDREFSLPVELGASFDGCLIPGSPDSGVQDENDGGAPDQDQPAP